MGDGSRLTAGRLADATGDPGIGRVTQVKSVRVGLATLLTGALGSFVANEPAPILALLLTEADCRDYVVSDVEPVFEATPALRGLLWRPSPKVRTATRSCRAASRAGA